MYKEAIQDAISTHELPSEWSSALLSEAEHVAQKKKTAKYRKDLRKLPFVTIDGEDAKDFDDAIYCVKNTSGYRLYVAIADVSFYVEANSKLDKEAKKRGTSIYFPETVIPMLPENLSNGICSLRPNEDRCSMICEMSIDLDGTRKKYKFYSGLINSKARLTYNQVEKHFKKSSTIKQSIVRESIKHLFDLTNLRLKLRNQRKALEINPTEAILDLNKNKEVNNIVVKRNLFAHKLVEESMLLANESAAEFMHDRLDLGVYRIHEEPEELKIDALKNFFAAKGLTSKPKKNPLEVITQCLEFSKDHQLKKSLQTLVLQSLKRAEYSTEDIGHFGLQLEQYAHFTSPIRRYPDLMVHRLIKDKLQKNINKPNQEQIELDCCELSDLERQAEKASRTVVQQIICHHLKQFIGDDFNAMITGVTDFGIFAEIDSFYVSGLIHVSDLPGDRYIFDKISGVLKGKRTGRSFRQGQSIRVKINNVLPYERKINLLILKNK